MEVLRTAILDFCRRKKGALFYPSEIVRQMFPEDWELFVEELGEELIRMSEENLIEISQEGNPPLTKRIPDLSVSISVRVKPK